MIYRKIDSMILQNFAKKGKKLDKWTKKEYF